MKVTVDADMKIKLPYLKREIFDRIRAVTPYRDGYYGIPLRSTKSELDRIRKAYKEEGFELELSPEAFKGAKHLTLRKVGGKVRVESGVFIKDLLPDNVLKTFCRWDPAWRHWFLRQTGAVTIAKEAFEKAGVKVTLEGLEPENTSLPKIQPPSQVNVTLYPFQQKGVRFILRKKGRAGLFDDVGLGKTIQATQAVLELAKHHRAKRVLVLAPSSLLYQWDSELRGKFNLEATIVTSKLSQEERVKAYENPLVLVNYELFRRDLDVVLTKQFDTLILDEVTRAKNYYTQLSDAVKAIIADNVIALTGTPIENRLSELYNIVNIVKPGFFGRWSDFVEAYGEKDGWGNVFLGREKVKALRAKLREVSIRRTKKQVLPQLPELAMEWVTVTLSPNQKKLYEYIEAEYVRELKKSRKITPEDIANSIIGSYDEAVKNLDVEEFMSKLEKLNIESFQDSVTNQPPIGERIIKNPFQRLTKLTLLREICADVSMLRNYVTDVNSRKDKQADVMRRDPFFTTLRKLVQEMEWENPKLDELLEILDAIKENHKAVVFTQFAQIVSVISNALTAKKIRYVAVTGEGMRAEEKNRAIQRFLSDENVRVLVTTDTMQYGMNLQSATNVVMNYDLPWTVAKLYQRIGRVVRIGQSAHKVVAINLMVQDTVEEHIRDIVEKKAELFKDVTGTNLMEEARMSASAHLFLRNLESESLDGTCRTFGAGLSLNGRLPKT